MWSTLNVLVVEMCSTNKLLSSLYFDETLVFKILRDSNPRPQRIAPPIWHTAGFRSLGFRSLGRRNRGHKLNAGNQTLPTHAHAHTRLSCFVCLPLIASPCVPGLSVVWHHTLTARRKPACNSTTSEEERDFVVNSVTCNRYSSYTCPRCGPHQCERNTE